MKKPDKREEAPETETTEPKKTPPPFRQPFYCHWKDGKWDRKFRDKEGNIVE